VYKAIASPCQYDPVASMTTSVAAGKLPCAVSVIIKICQPSASLASVTAGAGGASPWAIATANVRAAISIPTTVKPSSPFIAPSHCRMIVGLRLVHADSDVADALRA